MSIKRLYLEERVWFAREAINELTVPFNEMLPEQHREEHRELMLLLIAVLDGDRGALKVMKRLRIRKRKATP